MTASSLLAEPSAFDVAVIGAGPAGLSVALMLGRARRRVLVVDEGLPRNRFAAHMHGVLGHDGRSPRELQADGLREIAACGVVVRRGRAEVEVGDGPEPVGEEAAQLIARGVEIVTTRPVRMEASTADGRVDVVLADGTRRTFDRVFTMPAGRPNDGLLTALGASREDGPFGAFVPVDATGRTSAPGVWAVDNVVSPTANVPVAVSMGTMAGATVNADLIEEEFAAAAVMIAA